MRTSSLASWRRNALDLTVEACQLLAAQGGSSPEARQRLEAGGLRDALRWLRERPASACAELAAQLDDETILTALAHLDLPPPWQDPPERLNARLAQLEEQARRALRLHTQLVAPAPEVERKGAASLAVREETLPWPTPSPPTAARTSPVEAAQARARRRVEQLLAPPRPEAVDGAVVDRVAPATALPEGVLVLAARGGLWCQLPALSALPPEVSALRLQAGAVHVALLPSNLRSGPTQVPVAPSGEPYRLFSPEAPDDPLMAPIAGLDPARASAFRVRRDGHAERAPAPRLRGGERWRLLAPPALAHLPLPGSWSLGGGWRAIELVIEGTQAAEQVALLASLGLAPPVASVRLEWKGAAPISYRQQPGGERTPVLSARRLPLVQVTRHHAPGKLTLLLTSAQESASLDLTDEVPLVALDDLEPGAFCLDLVAEDPAVEPAQLSFLVARDEPRGPPATARARLGSRELTLGDDPQVRCALRGDEQLELELPPLWPVRLGWRGVATRRLGRRCADAEGRLDLSPLLTSLARELARAPVADLVVDAGELGQLTLQHERPFEPEATLGELVALLHERTSLLAASDPAMIRALWVEPVCRALGYQVSEPRRPGPDESWYQEMTILTRQASGFEAQRYALLFISPEPPSAEVLEQARRRTQTPRTLWTDGLRWRLSEQGRRHAGEALDLVRSPLTAARASLERLVARLGV